MTPLLLATSIALTPCRLLAEGPPTGHLVRLTAVYASYYHGAYLYEPGCGDADAAFDVSCDPDFDTAECSRGMERIARKSVDDRSGSRTQVELEGSLSDWDGVGYGHL